MCTYFIAIGQSEADPLIIAGNRDEFLSRATTGVHIWVPDFSFWPTGKTALAGKDEESGGTWLGVAGKRWAFVTNIRRPPFDATFPSTRGELPLRWLAGNLSLAEFGKWMDDHKANYAPFNLIFGEGKAVHFVSSDCTLRKNLVDGIYGISNASLDTPWPKVETGKKAMRQLLKSNGATTSALLALLKNKQRHTSNLPETGIGREKEVMLSALCVESADYGTRTHSVLRCSKDGEMAFETASY